jgi:hypothetical protein
MEAELFRKGAADCLAQARAADDPKAKYALIIMAQKLYEFARRTRGPSTINVGEKGGALPVPAATATPRSLARGTSAADRSRPGASMPMS